jgi:glycosyltransferase involved in cell wall biosynthesis
MATVYKNADCVVGTGRVALEAMACKRPVVAVGCEGFFGVVNSLNLDEAWACYFGDHSAIQPSSRALIRSAILEVLKGKDTIPSAIEVGHHVIKTKYNNELTTRSILREYMRLGRGKRRRG